METHTELDDAKKFHVSEISKGESTTIRIAIKSSRGESNNRIRKVDISIPQAVITFAGSRSQTAGATDGIGTGNAALFNGPRGITIHSGFLYVADTVNNKIHRIDMVSKDVTTLAGAANIAGSPGYNDGVSANASFYGPQGITNDGTNLYVADTINNKIRQIRMADGITTDGTNLYVSDYSSHIVRKVQ